MLLSSKASTFLFEFQTLSSSLKNCKYFKFFVFVFTLWLTLKPPALP
jgi:hypothetical protein